MTLTSGTQLGPYEITGLIGVGGMGEVYRATDTKLDREVAIKTLPSTLAEDQDRLARFEREAKLLAALNHAHIAAIHSLDEHEGTLFLAMELVEGETLEEKLKAGELPVDDALRMALQIAEALEAAHDKGVVHRDLKPANIMVNADGQVKVLDFGLAKAFSGDPNEASAAHSPALSMAMTQQGLVLGTAGYMSPEQASGQATDQRADVWAFGVVLYEMLTGLPLFTGESVPHILADVLRADPDWDRLPKDSDPRIKGLLERCLEKKVRNRYHGIADARVDIEKILSDPDGAAIPIGEAPEATPAPAMLPRLAAAFVIAVGLTAGAAWLLQPDPPPRPINRFSYLLPEDMGFRRNGENTIAVSPDGRHFVMNTTDGLLLRPMDTLEGRIIPGTEEDLDTPFYSPDGQMIGYWTPSLEIKRIGVSGGAPVVISTGVANPFGASWAPNGTILLANPEGIFRIPANGGAAELLFAVGNNERFHAPQLLPDGDNVLFSVAEGVEWNRARIVAQSITTGERTIVLEGGSTPRYIETGHLVYALGNDLFATAFDADALTISGAVAPLVQGVSRAFNRLSGLANYGVTDDGTLIYRGGNDGNPEAGVSAVWVDRNGSEEPVGIEPCTCQDPLVSPDGTRIAFAQVDLASGESDIWIWAGEQQTFTRLTFGPGIKRSPVWSPDGERIAYGGAQGIFVQQADGTGSVTQLLEEAGTPFSWSADGEIIYTFPGASGVGRDIGVLTVDGDAMPRTLLETEFDETRAALSPDGRWLAYQSDESGVNELYVRPYPDVDSGRWQVSASSGFQPQWSADSSMLIFGSGTGIMVATISDGPAFAWSTPTRLLDRAGYFWGGGSPRAYGVSLDGDRLLMLRGGPVQDGAADARPTIVIVENWVEELKRLVPTE